MTLVTKRFLIVIGYVSIALAAGLLIEVFLSHPSGWQFGHSQKGHVAGWIGFAVTMTVFGYSAKKRFGRKAGRPKGWFLAHQAAGIAGPLLILVHSGPHFHAWVPILALLAMGVTAVSGLIGVAVHRKALSLLDSSRRELFGQGLSEEDVEDRLYELASSEEAFRIWRVIHVPVAMIFLTLAVIHIAGALYLGGL